MNRKPNAEQPHIRLSWLVDRLGTSNAGWLENNFCNHDYLLYFLTNFHRLYGRGMGKDLVDGSGVPKPSIVLADWIVQINEDSTSPKLYDRGCSSPERSRPDVVSESNLISGIEVPSSILLPLLAGLDDPVQALVVLP